VFVEDLGQIRLAQFSVHTCTWLCAYENIIKSYFFAFWLRCSDLCELTFSV
jgi:hypothetical protein